MKPLSYARLRELGYNGYLLEHAPERVMQFGEGNFLRAFVNHWIDLLNERVGWNGKCLLVQPIPTGLCETINAQQGLYTLYLRGMERGERVDRKRVISAVSRCVNPYTDAGFDAMLQAAESDALRFVVSNTTEAGIVYDPDCRLTDRPAASFPGKLTQVLYARFRAGKGGLVILSCELIDHNGEALERCVRQYARQWALGSAFERWLGETCLFCSTLVDRIVPGRVKDPAEAARMEAENGYRDALMDVGETFGVWNIQGPASLEEELPFGAAGLPCTVVPDVTPYKQRKVRILNGAHTGFVPGAYLAGFDLVRDCVRDDVVRGFMNRMLQEEILPTLDLPRADLDAFAAAVQDRFQNPFVDHELLSISLNSTSKWRARNLPSLLARVRRAGALPRCLVTSFAAYLAFYTTGVQALEAQGLRCRRPAGNDYLCRDDRWVLEFFWEHRADDPETLTRAAMQNERMWGMDLTQVPGFCSAAAQALALIRRQGAAAAFAACL